MRISDWSSDVCSSDLACWTIVGKLSSSNCTAETLTATRSSTGQLAASSQVLRSAQAPIFFIIPTRSEERRVGKECVSTCRSRWSPYHYKTKQKKKYSNKHYHANKITKQKQT